MNPSFTVPNTRSPEHPIDPQFKARWSPRSFANYTMQESEVLTLLEAARWAPSASNVQPWRYVFALKEDPLWVDLFASVNLKNQVWVTNASAILVMASQSMTPQVDSAELKPNPTHAFDTGTAWGFLALQAYHSGLAVHALAGFNAELAAKAVNLPADHQIHALVAIGKQGDPQALPQDLRQRELPNGRHPIASFVRRGKFVTS